MATTDKGIICDFCGKPAIYDSPTIYAGRWAHTCGNCFRLHTNLVPESQLVTRLRKN